MTHSFKALAAIALCVAATAAHGAEKYPLHHAIDSGWSPAQVEELLAGGANVNAKDDKGDAPLHVAVVRLMDDRDIIVKLLLARGADVNARNNDGETPLWNAVLYKSVFELLLAGGADPNTAKNDGYCVLHQMIYGGKTDLVKLMLDKGANVNLRNKGGWTPLNYSVYQNKKEIAELLLDRGADATIKNDDGYTPLQVAALWDKNDLMEVLLVRGVWVKGDEKGLADREKHILAQAGNPRALFSQLLEQIKKHPWTDASSRRLIVQVARRLKPAPAIPEEARRHFIEGSTIVKAGKSPTDQALAVQSFEKAVAIAPWWPDAYYNLGVAQDLAENYDGAEQAFNFYLLGNVSEAERREVQDRIYGLAAKRKLSGAK